MDNINFLVKPSFPLSSDTLEFMQQTVKQLESLTALGGTDYILSGCTVKGTSVTDGYIVLKGELLPFKGGTLSSTFIVAETKRNVVALGETYNDVYTEREARFGSGSPQYNWNDLKRITDLLSLKSEIAELTKTVESINSTPRGTVSLFAGETDKIPVGWALCDGSLLNITDHPELFEILGAMHGGNTTQFKLPDLRGRFVLGCGTANGLPETDLKPNYTIGETGGSNTVTLQPKQQGSTKIAMRVGKYRGGGNDAAWQIAINDTHIPIAAHEGWAAITSHPQNNANSHENRPPYYVLAYIIKL